MKRLLLKFKINTLIIDFSCLFVTYLLLTRIVPINIHLEGGISSLISIVFAFTGCLLAIIKIIEDYKFYKNKYSITLLIFIIIAIISSIINIKYGFLSNFKMLIWMFIQYFLLFSVVNFTRNEISIFIKKMSYVIIGIMFICTFISLIQFILNINYQIILPDYPRNQGFLDGRLYGVFDDPNYAAVTSIIALSFSFYSLCNQKQIWAKVFNIFNIFLQISYIILCNSRTGLISLVICILIVAYYFANNRYFKEKKIFSSILFFIIICCFSLIAIFTIHQLYSYAPQVLHKSNDKTTESFNVSKIEENENKENSIQNEDSVQNENNLEKQDSQKEKAPQESEEKSDNLLERDDIKADISNNRIDIWKNAIELSKGHRVFGLSPRNMLSFAKLEYPYSYTAQTGYETHNGYLSVFIGSGYVGSITILVFIFFCLSNFIKKMLLPINSQTILVMMIIGTFSFSLLTLQDVFFMNTATSAIFWIMLGIGIFGGNENEI